MEHDWRFLFHYYFHYFSFYISILERLRRHFLAQNAQTLQIDYFTHFSYMYVTLIVVNAFTFARFQLSIFFFTFLFQIRNYELQAKGVFRFRFLFPKFQATLPFLFVVSVFVVVVVFVITPSFIDRFSSLQQSVKYDE